MSYILTCDFDDQCEQAREQLSTLLVFFLIKQENNLQI